MVSRRQKLIAAGTVLAVGVGAACLFRREPPAANWSSFAEPAAAPAVASAGPTSASVFNGQFSPQPPVPASMAASSFGAAAGSASAAVAPPALPPLPGVSFAGAENRLASDGEMSEQPAPPGPPPQVVIVIQRGDTLERIAERCLGDASRAWELFDLNRDVLDNPHILPLGAELRMPASASAATVDAL